MFDVGFTELLLIGVVSLVVIGPERLPDVARTVGKWIGKTQRFVRGVKSDIANELDSGELKQLIGDQREQIDELRKMVRTTARDIESTTTDAVRGARRKLAEMEEAVEEAEEDIEAAADAAAELPPPASAPTLAKRSDETGAGPSPGGGGEPLADEARSPASGTAGSPAEVPAVEAGEERARASGGTGGA